MIFINPRSLYYPLALWKLLNVSQQNWFVLDIQVFLFLYQVHKYINTLITVENVILHERALVKFLRITAFMCKVFLYIFPCLPECKNLFCAHNSNSVRKAYLVLCQKETYISQVFEIRTGLRLIYEQERIFFIYLS